MKSGTYQKAFTGLFNSGENAEKVDGKEIAKAN